MISVSKLLVFITTKQSKINSTIPLKTFHRPNKTLSLLAKMSSWTCSKCTYINPSTQTPRCEICLSSSSTITTTTTAPSSPSKPKWSCASCTFLNPYHSTICEICGTRASASILSTLEVDDDEAQLGSSIGSVFLPLRSCSGAGKGNSEYSDTGGNRAGLYGGLRSSVSPLRRGDCVNFGNKEKKDNYGECDFGGERGFSLSRCSNKRKERDEIDTDGGGGSNGFRVPNSANNAVEVKSLALECAFGGKRDLPLTRCSNKRKEMADIETDAEADDARVSCGFRAPKRANSEAVEVKSLATGESSECSESKSWKVLSYNIWFREDVEMRERMRALGNLIELHSPDVICFQEVTPSFYNIFERTKWWKGYQCSIPNEMSFPGGYFCMQLCKLPVKSYGSKPFHNSIMGRELCVAEIEMQPNTPITVATSHLESPCPGPPTWDQMFSKERVEQANEAVKLLDKNQNAVFCGDMNWDDKLDGPFPLPDGWADAWIELRPGEVGWTYDTKSNKMLSGNKAIRKRLDRFVCKLNDFKMSRIEMIGTDEIPGLTYVKEKRVKGQVLELVLPVCPSDHYGLLLTISPK